MFSRSKSPNPNSLSLRFDESLTSQQLKKDKLFIEQATYYREPSSRDNVENLPRTLYSIKEGLQPYSVETVYVSPHAEIQEAVLNVIVILVILLLMLTAVLTLMNVLIMIISAIHSVKVEILMEVTVRDPRTA